MVPSGSIISPYSRVCLRLGKNTRRFSMPSSEMSAATTSLSSDLSPKLRRCTTRSPPTISESSTAPLPLSGLGEQSSDQGPINPHFCAVCATVSAEAPMVSVRQQSNASGKRLKCAYKFLAPLAWPCSKLSTSIPLCNATWALARRLAESPGPAHHPSIEDHWGRPACPHCHAAIFLRLRDRLLP